MTLRLSHTQAAALLGHTTPAKPRRLRIVESQPRLVVDSVDIVLPLAPSLNTLWFNRKSGGRGKTQAYRDWIKEAGYRLCEQHPGRIVGKYAIELLIGRSHKDLGNAGEKAISDLLTRHKIIDDDSQCEDIRIRWQDADQGVRVIVSKWRGA